MRSDAEAWAIAIANRGLIHSYLRSIRAPFADREDAESDLMIALFKAAQTWDPERSRLSRWAKFQFNAALRQRWRRHGKEADWTEPVERKAACPRPEIDAALDLHAIRVRHTQSAVPSRTCDAVSAWLDEPLSAAKIAEEHGISRQALSAALRTMRSKL